MKTNWLKYVCLALLCPMLWACSEEEEGNYIDSPPHPLFNMGMILTNETGWDYSANVSELPHYDDDLLIQLDDWHLYMDGERIELSEKDKLSRCSLRNLKFLFKYCRVFYVNGFSDVQHFVTSSKESYYAPHVMEQHFVSKALFGDDQTHVLRITFQMLPEKPGIGWVKKYECQWDGKDMEVYYPKGWEMEPIQTDYDVDGIQITSSFYPIAVIRLDK